MGYVEGSLQPREVCVTKMVWVPAEDVYSEDGLPDTSDLGPLGERVYFGDVGYNTLPGVVSPTPPGVGSGPEFTGSPVPIPTSGVMFLFVVLIVLSTMLWRRLFHA